MSRPILDVAANLADNAAGALHSAAVQPTPAAVLRRVLADLQAAAEIVAGALPAEAPPVDVEPEPVAAPKPKRSKR